MIAHQCHHDAWGLILARQLGSYWGHAAWLDLHIECIGLPELKASFGDKLDTGRTQLGFCNWPGTT